MARVALGLVVATSSMLLGCQRLPEPSTSNSGGDGPQGDGGTFLPGDPDDDSGDTGTGGSGSADETTGVPGECSGTAFGNFIDSPAELEGVGVVDGSLMLSGLTQSDLLYLQCLREVEDSFAIRDSPALVDLTGLEALERVGDSLILERNSSLQDIDALEGMVEVGGLRVVDSPALGSLEPLRGVWTEGKVELAGCDSLTELHLDSPTRLYQLDVMGCPQLATISLPLVEQTTLSLTDLPALVDLDMPVVQRFNQSELRDLASLASLEGVDTVEILNHLVLVDMPQLTHVELPLAERAAGIDIQSAASLQHIALPSLEQLGTLRLSVLPELEALPLLSPALRPNGLELFSLPRVESLAPLGALEDSMMWLSITELPLLSDLSSLETVEHVQTELVLSALPSLTSIEPLSSVSGPLDRLILTDLPALTDLSPLDGLALAHVTVVLRDLDAVTSLSGLDGLATVGAELIIEGNDQLLALDGLGGLEQVGAWIHVLDNPALVDISGLASAPFVPAGALGTELRFIDNGSLSQCDVLELAAALQDAGWMGVVSTSGNLPCP